VFTFFKEAIALHCFSTHAEGGDRTRAEALTPELASPYLDPNSDSMQKL